MICSHQTCPMQINSLYTRSTSNNGTDLCQQRNLMVRTHPKLHSQEGVGITSDWQHWFICTCRFCNWFPDTQMVLWVENINCNRSVIVKRTDQNFQGESKVENRLRIERRGIEKRSRVLKKKGIAQKKGKQITDFEVIETDGMYPCRTEYTSNTLVSRN